MGGMDRFYKRKKEKEKQSTPAVSSTSGGMDRYYKKQYYNTLDTSVVNDDYLKTFVSDANSFISGVGSNKLSYADATSRLGDLSSKYDTVSAWLYKNKSKLDEKSYNSISTALGELKSGFDSINKYYSQWESDEDYNKYLMGWLNTEATTDEKNSSQRKSQYQSNTERISEIDKELPFYAGSSWVPNFAENLFLSDEQEARRNELEKRKAENKQYERTQKAIDDYYVPVTDEFLKNASYRDYKNATREELWNYNVSEQEGSLALNSGGYFDDEGNIRDSDGNIVQYANAPMVEDKLGLFLSTTEDERTEAYNELLATNGNYTNTWANLIQDGDVNGWAYLTENEVNIYYDLYKREGQEAAYRYLDAMTPELTRRATQETTDYINNAEGLEKVFLNAASIPMNVFGGAFSFVDDAANVLQGEDINPYSRAHAFQNAATDIRSKTAADIDKWTGNVAIPFIDFSVGDTYQALMSGADSMLGVAIGGNAYGVLMGMGAASSTAKDLYTKGATTEQIVTGSLLAGAAEMVFEKYSIDELVKGANAKSIKDIIVNMLTQSGVEATEEMATEIANTLTNYIIMGEQSDWVDLETFIKNVVNAGLGGFISGGGMSGIYSTAQKVVYDKQVKEYGKSIIDQGGVENLQATASKLTENKVVAKLINKVAKNTSAKNVGKLATTVQNVTDTNDKVNMVSELVDKGLSKREAAKVADFVTELSHGYEPSSNEIAEIEKITDKLPDVVDTTSETATIRDSRTVDDVQPTEETAQSPAVASLETARQTGIDAEPESVPAEENAAEAKTTAFEDAEESPVSLEEASKKYGAQAAAMVSTYTEGQDVAKYDAAYRAAYDMGSSGVNLSYAMNSELTSYLTENQRELAYSAGADASTATAKEQDAANKAKANGNTGRRKGTVRGDGVTIADIKTAVNDKQGTAYKLLSTYAEATGIDIVLYKSSTNEKGEFEGAQGKFKWSENTIYIDVNAGLANVNDVNELAKYTMLRTFAHEFTHFIEKWNPIQYNEFRKVVFDTLTERGENVDELITAKMAQNEGMTYDAASRETVAEAMTDILPDANFVEELATNHKTVFNKLLEKLKEFVSELKTYFNSLLSNRSREANALKEQVGESVRYVESIVKLFDKVAVEAVKNYQMTVAIEEVAETKSDFAKSFENATQEERDEVVEAINANTKISHIAPTETYGEQSTNTEEVKPNVEETGTVLPHRSDGERDTRLLEEPQTEDVSGDGAERNAVDDAGERRNEAGRSDNRTDAERTGGRSSERSSESADIRRDDGLTSEESTAADEKLHEEVEEKIAQQSTEQPKGRNFVIGESLDLPNGEKSRYKANVEAIRLVKQLEAEKRYATEAEQVILSKYVGWGGLANAFDQRKTDWAKEYAELKELLTEEEYASARGSTLNAHFTDISVIKAMYDGLSSLGFNGGRMLEPSSGVGNFVGAMPADMTAKVKSWTMVELDGITGLIAKYLYPNADVRIQGFEKANIPDNYMDVAISNVPFGNYAITDKAYPKKVTSAIHNYFFAKSLDKVRPGGIVMFITSSYTMNSKEDTVRRYIMQRADLLGAIRLPDSAFKGNAGTEVVTDILILKKRAANTVYAGEDFLEAPYKYIKGYNGAYINSYFENHPEMVLGTASMDGGMYRGNSLTYKALEGKGSLADQIREAFSHINGKMDYPATLSREKTNFAVEKANKKTKENGLVVKDGKVYQNRSGELVEVNAAKGAAERISGMLEIRDAAKDLMTYQQQGLNESEIKKARTKLNKVYDAFVKKYGYINAQANKTAIKDDPDKFSIFALENWNSETKKATKADIFSKNTVAPNRTVTSAKDVSEGLIVSVNQTGGVDVPLIAALTRKSVPDVTRELIDSRQAFKNRDGELEPAEVYLSGNVRAKLRDAEALVPIDSDYANNVEALKSVMPEDVGYQDIFVNPGTPWIPNSVYSDFAAYMLGTRNTDWRKDVDITRNSETGNFTVELNGRHLKYNAANTQKWGIPRRTFLELFDAMLNSKSVVIKDKLDDGSFVINKDATAAANEKIENIQKEFQEWLWKDEARRTELATLYNETFNSIVTPKYNGDNLTVNGANALKPLRAHQRNAVQRVVSSGGNTLLAHRVGAGKTYEMAAAAMKLKELGLVKKPMFAVPKSLVAQWGVEFMDFFPTAKLLVAEAGDFTASNRKVFMNRIANGEYDAVIVSYEQFEKLPISNDFARNLYQEQIDSIVAAIEEAKAEKGGKSLSVKDLEKKRKSLQTKIDKLTDKAKDEDNIDFEQLGVDSLFVDEAHNFKNLFYTTSMTNVSGLGNKDGSKRAFDLYTKVRYLQQLNGGRGIVFATATPVMNSMSEMYIMQKYLQPDLLNQLGLSTFDAWAKQFGEVVNGVEIKPSGQGYRVKQSFSRFKNMGELQLLFRNFADVLTDIPGLKIPKMKGGKVNVVVCESGEFQQNFMKELEKRADNIKNVDPSEDNMLKITSDGRKISYTQRMIDPSLPYEEGCKLYRCADNVIKEYNESKGIKGTQLIFCDMATPKGKSDNSTETEDIEMDMESTQLYDDLKARLRHGGIPAKEIAFIHDADTDQKKKKLFADVNDGKVRVLIGSTGKMGVGMNAQKRVVAIHHLDAPWRPGDVEQRDGRAFRQGNINEEVTKYTYVTEGSFDARLWDILDRKQTFINQIMNGESVGREAEDTGEVTLSAAEVKALASGSPLIMEQVQLDTDIKKLESLYRAHASSIRSAKDRLMRDHGKIAELERLIESGKADVAATIDTYSDNKFAITIGKAKYTDKKEAGVALMAEITAKAVDSGYTTVGSFAGFKLRVTKTKEGITGLLTGKQDYPFKTYPTNTTFMINHLIATVESISEKVKLWEHTIAETQADVIEQEKLIATPFAKQEELDNKRTRYNEVMAILNPKEEQSLDSVDEGKVQEQSRAYLSNNKYSYEWFISKPDMALTSVNDSVKYNRADIVSLALKNAASVGYTNQNGNAVVHVDDTDTDVIVPKRSLVHGLDRRINTQAPVLVEIGNVLKNSIRVNELIPRAVEIRNTYVLIGAAQNQDGNLYIASFVVNKYSNEVSEIDVLYSANAKKESAALLPKITDKSATPTDSAISIEHLLEYVNIYFPDILPESVLKHFGHDARPEGTIGEDALYQQRTTTLTDREVLAMAADKLAESKLSEAERDALQIFQSRLSRLEGLQIDRAEAGRLYKEQQFGANVNRTEAAQTLNRMKVLDEQIKTAEADVLSIEDKKVFGEVLKKARKVVETEQRAHDAELVKRWRDRTQNAAAVKKYRERIRTDVNELTNWALKPNNKDIVKHIPDVLKNSVIPFLSSIDFTSKQQLRGGEATKADKEFVKRLNGLKSALKQNIDVNGLYSGYNDLPANFMEKLQTLIDAVQAITEKKSGEFVINQMTSEELKELSNVVRVIKAYITQINKFHANAMFQHVYEAGDSTIDSLSVMESDNGKSGTVSNFVFWQQIRPAFAFERFGSGGIAIYDGLRRGQALLAFNTKKIVDFTEKAYTEAEVKAWEKEIKQINLGGDIVVKMPVSMIMSFYELSKQPDSLRHMLGEGFRVATYTNKGKKISDNGHTLTNENISTIINELTPRQKEVADALQKFMAEQGGAWGNYVSVKRFGEELFTNEQYFPINSDGRHLQATADEQPSAASLYALLNMSFTKSRNELANNRIIVYSIFDVFSNHMASMAQYNAMALPVLDAIKWFNYQQKTEDHDGNKYVKDGVREQMARVYGVSEETRPGAGNKSYAESFVLNILKAFNGTEAQGVPTDSVGMNALRNYNMAQVAYNFRVVVQQPLAITRAALLVDYGSIVKGMKLNPSAIKQNIEEMRKYSGIAAWKSLGFYDVNISRGLTDTIKHNSDWKQKIGEIGMWSAEQADSITWAGIWSACKEEVIKKQKLTPKSEGFYEAVTELFEEVIYKTQVVDSILTKNEYLRSKGLFARITGSFMSEPTTTASMLIDAVDKYNADIKRGMTRQQAWEKNKRMIGRVMYVYGVSAVILAAVQAVADAMRDDDDYETFVEKWLEAFGGNLVDELMPFNKLPLLSDFYDLAKELISLLGVDTYGNPPQSVFMQWYDSLVKGFEILYDKISGEDTNYTWYGGAYKLLQAASGMTGLPMAAATREAITAWNNIVGAMAPSLKVTTYDSGEQNEIKYAYADGYLTFEEAVNALVEQGLVDNEDEAYFTVQGWETGEGYSRYDALENAVRNGTGVDEAIYELTSHGYTEDDIYSRIKSKTSEWYKNGEITKAQATNILEKYADMDRDEITEYVNKWSSFVVTGIEYDDIDEEFMAGNITASRAIEMYTRYGSMTQEKATEKVAVLSFVKEHPECEGITHAAVKAYTQYCEPYGIEAETFYDVWQYNSSVSADVDASGKAISGSKKAKVLAYVNSLALSARRKDSLYYALGYAESTIDEAPWR